MATTFFNQKKEEPVQETTPVISTAVQEESKEVNIVQTTPEIVLFLDTLVTARKALEKLTEQISKVIN